MAVYPNPSFIKDKGSVEYDYFAALLKELGDSFITISIEGEKKFIHLLTILAEHSYQHGQLLREELMRDQDLFVEQDLSQPSL